MRLTVLRLLKASEMAKSKYEYVKKFEREMSALPGCFLVVRIDGKGFHRYDYSFSLLVVLSNLGFKRLI